MQCDGVLLGREPVDGAVNASTLASLVRTLTSSRRGTMFGERRYTLRCRDGLELLSTAKATAHTGRPRRLDDEGFESDADDDTASTRSITSTDDTVSNSSSCCFVDDHVFKFPSPSPTSSRGLAISSSSSVATDSANSSGASDTDDVDTSGAPSPSSVAGSVSKLVQSLSLYQRGAPATADVAESYAINDIAFCHTDPAFPKVVVWVVKKRRLARLTCTGAENAKSGLEAIVFECPNERGLRKLCGSFQELSRRVKLEQYRHPHRRKDSPSSTSSNSSLTLSTSSSIKPNAATESSSTNRTGTKTAETNTKSYTNKSFKESNDNTKSSTTGVAKTVDILYKSYSPSTNPKTAENSSKPYAIVPQPKTLPKPSRPSSSPTGKDDIGNIQLTSVSKFNLVQRTDGNGVTHTEVSRGLVQDHVPVETNEGPSSIISISTPDVGNLLSSTPGKSRLCKEIEGVIRTDVDSAHRREATTRQRQPAILVMNEDGSGGELRKVWSPPEEDHDDEDVVMADPPQRPERRKYIRKKTPAPLPPMAGPKKIHPQTRHQPEVVVSQRNTGNQQKVVRGQFIRVSVDQPTPSTMVVQTPSPWVYTNGGPKILAYSPTPSWCIPPLKSSSRETGKTSQRKGLDDIFSGQQKHHRRSRSSGGGSKSPPVARRPMAYRYIDVAPSNNTLSNRFFGLSQKLRDLGGAVSGSQGGCPYATTARRRGSGGEDHDRYLQSGGGQGNLKSVIKKGGGRRAGEYGEPKKVTFSAYATVQVVD